MNDWIGWGPASPKLLTEIERQLRTGKVAPYELLCLVWQQPKQYYHDKYEAYRYLFEWFRVHAAISDLRRFKVQFFISFLALREHEPQGYLEWVRGKRDPRIFTRGLVNLESPRGEDLRAEAVRMLENVNSSMTSEEIANQAFNIIRKFPPPRLPLEASSQQIAEKAVKKALEQLKKVEGQITDAQKLANSRIDHPEKDEEVRGACNVIQEQIDKFKHDHHDLLSNRSNLGLVGEVAKLEKECKEISPKRSIESLVCLR